MLFVSWKGLLLEFDSLPPVAADSSNAAAERALATEVYEHAAILAVNVGDKNAFQRYVLSLRPYYTTYA
jgi:hypothetical protein